MKLLLHSKSGTYPHPKNYDGLQRMCKSMNIIFEHTTDINKTYQDNYDILVAYNEFIEPDKVPSRIKIIYGPGMFIFPSGPLVGPRRHELATRCVFNTLSEWNKKVHEEIVESMIVPIHTFPYGIETDYFIPNNEPKTIECILYVKSRDNHSVQFVKSLLESKGIQYKIYKYGSYDGNEYRNTLTRVKYLISLDAHESQGFALQEAMSCNVPLLVCDVKSMFDDIANGNNPTYLRKDFPGKNLYATSVPYWSDECGLRTTDIYQMSDLIDRMHCIYATFTPRNFIMRTLSNEVCMKRILDYFGLSP